MEKIPMTLSKPIIRDGEWTYEISVNCRKCANCLVRRKSEWGFRMEKEMERSKTAYFVTLTYKPEYVPYNNKGLMVLNKSDLDKFFKRLRQNQLRSNITIEHIYNNLKNEDKVSYWAAGEYGDIRKRPHFHAIIFNASRKNIEKAWTNNGDPIGDVQIVPANSATIAYVMKYLDKRHGGKIDKRKPREFNVQSKGIGDNYLTPQTIRYHKSNLDCQFIRTIKGLMIPMPEYYRKKIFTEDERLEIVQIVNNALSEKELKDRDGITEEEYIGKIKSRYAYQTEKFVKSSSKRITD